jgi:hypothetical protein
VLLRFSCNGALQRLDMRICLRLPATRAIVVAHVRGRDILVNRTNRGSGQAEHRHRFQARRLHDMAEGAENRLAHLFARRRFSSPQNVLVFAFELHDVLRLRIPRVNE